MLKLRNISVSFDKKEILKNISCTIESGDFIVIVGGNGAGKSTFFDTIAGKNIPDSGTILFNNQDITSINESSRAKFISRIFQNTHLNSVGTLTVLENLALSQLNNKKASFRHKTADMSNEKALELIQKIGLSESILHTRMSQISGGQRQLIAFVMATQQIPSLLLLDEPTAALDPQSATTLLVHATTFIKEHKITTLLITHDPYIAMTIGNKIWILENGQIIKTYEEEEKTKINDPNSLIGQINYSLLKTIQ
jgi:putative ABC transport system ATP-binding protein